MKKFLELEREVSAEPVLIDISSITMIMPENKKCSRIYCQGGDYSASITVRITYHELVAKLTALGVCEVV